MPAKRSPKKSRKPSSGPSVVDVTLPDVDIPAVAPAAPVALPASTQAEIPPPPKGGPPAGRDARFAGRSQRAGQTRRYAFRRS
ncbi:MULTISPECIES: hypothetical protein [Micromonospora]|uniref:Uncharacterized protein n=1 Tax=Micromonospora sicca TaxID=2202420 RepID=A0A317DHX2_9ACTN|nr:MULTISPECIES: hypothetical protein [unclassified Micromonospora]MBM0226325.1 hypothetical protein [Micromonospora sp. ATA51]MDZ5443841.1 hypothetical protein [Micromonospora sp. 4G57]MDZ5489641.1 hypothetical protein [Micromonospora sp. 4G53]PWR13336.1 hypothetical protein DKT69_21180 [Micromonospora sp. 4G51]